MVQSVFARALREAPLRRGISHCEFADKDAEVGTYRAGLTDGVGPYVNTLT